jgi:hypothetical protein
MSAPEKMPLPWWQVIALGAANAIQYTVHDETRFAEDSGDFRHIVWQRDLVERTRRSMPVHLFSLAGGREGDDPPQR